MKKALLISFIVLLLGASTVLGMCSAGMIELPVISDFVFKEETVSEPEPVVESEPEPESEPELESEPESEPEPEIPLMVEKSAEVDAAYDEIFEKYDPVGVSLAVFENGEIVHTYNRGYRDLKKKIKCDSDTKYRVASLSKTFSAITAMHMVDAGLLDLDKNIEEYLGYKVRAPGYPDVEITMKMLLTHTSSIYDCPLYTESTSGGKFHSNQSILASGSAYTGKKPGSAYRYTNFGIALSGAVMEAASDEYFSDYARKKVFVPMGIDAAYIPKELTDTENMANCYGAGHGVSRSVSVLMQQHRRFADGQLQGHAQGSLMISAHDYAVGLMMLMNGGEYDGKRTLSEESAKKMLTVQFDDGAKVREALCMREWTVFAGSDRKLLCHSGDSFGILAAYAVDPETKSGVVVITNGAKQSQEKETNYFNICYDYLTKTYEYI